VVRALTDSRQKHVLFLAANARSFLANRGDLVREIISRGHEVSAIVPQEDFLPEMFSLGIDIHVMPLARTVINPLKDLRTFYRYYRVIGNMKPDVIFAYGAKPVIYGLPAGKMAGVQGRFGMITGLGTVFIRRDRGWSSLLRIIVTALYRNAFRCAQQVFFQNPDDIADFKRSRIIVDDRKVVRTMGSGVNLTRFERFPLPEGPPTFLFIGRLLTEKGLAEFCGAAEIVKKGRPDCRFIAVGYHDPKLPHSVSPAQLKAWKRTGVVEFPGGVSDVRPSLRACSVFVLPSYREGTPRSALEAMATGRAIITTNAPGCRETVRHGENGFLVPVRDVNALAEAMGRFLENPALIIDMGEVSYKRVKEDYDVRTVNRVICETLGLS
jgi:glycosyltransferase involved in cell wall biosynthesis